jgi:hypothetical protein
MTAKKPELKHTWITKDFIKFLDLELDATYISALSSEEKNLLLLDLQMVTEWIKKVMLTIRK